MRADLTLVVSPFEKGILEKECPGIDVRILSTIYPLEERDVPGFDGRRDIVFIGGFQHLPNADAVLYFAREIFPLVRDRLPDAVFQVIGPDAPPEILALASPSIQILGHVPDVRPLFDRARVSVAPLRFGAGVKGKVNQSMALGVPTVVTSIAAEGMYLVHENNAMIAEDPERFADAVVRLWTTPSFGRRFRPTAATTSGTTSRWKPRPSRLPRCSFGPACPPSFDERASHGTVPGPERVRTHAVMMYCKAT